MMNTNAVLEEYYKNPIMDSWTYVNIGMDNLQIYDLGMYKKIKEKQELLVPQMEDWVKNIKLTCERLGFNNYTEIESYIEHFVQKFPLALRNEVGWDDVNFIFLYILIRVLKPEVIIETGCSVGFSSSFIALASKENNIGCKFYTIEPSTEFPWENLDFVKEKRQKCNYKLDKCTPLCIVPPDLREYIVLRVGYSRDILPKLLEENGRVDIFFHDSDHSYRNMLWECSTALPYIKIGGYIFAHDIFLNSLFTKIFVRKEGAVIGDNLGIFRKTSETIQLNDKELISPVENVHLNDHEYESKIIELTASPKTVIVQCPVGYDLDYIFYPRKTHFNVFDFDIFRRQLDSKICYYFYRAERIVFRDLGDFFQLPNIRQLFVYLQCSFDSTDKIFCTNGMGLTPQVQDIIFNDVPLSGKNIINILLPASTNYLYKVITKTEKEDFYKVIGQIKQLLSTRKKRNKNNLIINFNFIATTLNIENLPNVVSLAANLGINKVICNYYYISSSDQKYLSCFFKQKLTNRMFDEAERVARNLNIKIELPPRFGLKEYPMPSICRKPWSQIILNGQGHIISCDTQEDTNETLDGKDFMDVWNGLYFQNLRKSLIDGNAPCFKHCFRTNPSSVNDFRSHVVHRDILWGDNF